jgi:hypothetical protein
VRLERHHRDSNSRLSGLQRSATTCPTGGSERLLNCCNTNRPVCVCVCVCVFYRTVSWRYL